MTTSTVLPISAPAIVGGGSMPTTGRWGWYKDHQGTEYRRVSTLIKKVETDTYNLDLWKMRQVAEGMAIRDDLVLGVKAMGRPPTEGWTRDQKRDLNRIVETAQEAAKQRDGAVRGTAMHTLTERLDRGEPLERVAAGLPAMAGEGIRAYAAMRALNGWVSVEIERTVVCDELEVAGTFDRVDLVPGLAALLGPGTCQHGCETHTISMGVPGGIVPPELPVVIDVKTEESPWMNGLHIGPQLGIYSRARRMWRPIGREGGEYVPTPCVRQDVGIVVHLFEGHARPYLINLTEGWEAAVAAYEQMNRESRAKRKLGAVGAWFVPVPNVIEPKPAQTFVEHAAAERYADVNRPDAAPIGPPYAVGDVVTARVFDKIEHSEGEQVAVRDPATGLVSWQVTPAPAHPAHVMEAGGPDHYAAGLAQLLGDAIGRGDAGTIDRIMSDPYLSGDDLDTARGAMAALRPGPGTLATATAQLDAKDDLQRKLIEAIWQARTVDALSVLWRMAQDRGVLWSGPVAMAGDARRRQIECPQRALHAGANAKCACGWVSGIAA